MNIERSFKRFVSHLFFVLFRTHCWEWNAIEWADENSQATGNNNQLTSFIRPSQSSEHLLSNAQNSAQSTERKPIDEEGASQTLLPGMAEWFVCIDKKLFFFRLEGSTTNETPQMEQKANDESAVDSGANAASGRSMNTNLQKQLVPANDLDNDRSNKWLAKRKLSFNIYPSNSVLIKHWF